MFFGFQLTLGLMMAFYGFSVMKNPRVWGDQGRRAVKAENFEEYCRQNGQFFLKAGCVVAVIGALDALITLDALLYALLYIFWLGLCLLPPYPLVQAERGLLMAVAPRPEREKAHQRASPRTAGTGERGKRGEVIPRIKHK